MILLFLLLSASYAAALPADGWCQPAEVASAMFGKNLTQLYGCSHLSPLHIPYLWSPLKLTVSCPSTRYKVWVGDSTNNLVTKLGRREEAFCGLHSLFLDGTTCNLMVSPFQDNFVGIKANQDCTLLVSSDFSYAMLACLLVGVLLYSSSDSLSSSAAFRVSCGAATFVMGSLLIILLLLIRSTPYKRQVTAAAAVLGTSGMAALRWATGQWLPSIEQLIHNQYVAGYVLASAAIGAAVTYYYDDRDDPKMNTLIKITLRLLSLVLVYHGTWTFFPLSAAIISLLLASSFSPELAETVTQAVSPFVTPFVTPFATPLATPLMAKTKSALPIVRRSPPRSAPEFSFTQLRQQLLGVAASHTYEVGTPGSLTNESPTGSPFHLKVPAPEPPAKPWPFDAAPDVKSFEEKMEEHKGKLKQRSTDAANAGALVRASDGVHSGADDPMDVSHPPSPGASDRIKNVASGRMIKIGGPLYNKLVREGHISDMGRGILSPPVSPEPQGSQRPSQSEGY